MALINSEGIKVKTLDVPSNSDGSFKVNSLKIPSNGEIGKWKINVSSGSNLDISEFNVVSTSNTKTIITVEDNVDIPGFGKNIKIGISLQQKTTVIINIIDQYGNRIGDTTSCTPTADFKCEVLWTIPKDTLPGTHTIRVDNSITVEELQFEIK